MVGIEEHTSDHDKQRRRHTTKNPVKICSPGTMVFHTLVANENRLFFQGKQIRPYCNQGFCIKAITLSSASLTVAISLPPPTSFTFC